MIKLINHSGILQNTKKNLDKINETLEYKHYLKKSRTLK